jgi:metallo-beta-lactamase family protein
LVAESTYGDRVHEPTLGGEKLAAIIHDTVRSGGKLIIPAFAVGRVEEVIYWLKKLEEAGKIPILPVFLDSPMAIDALRDYSARSYELDPDVRPARGEVSAFYTARFQTVSSPQQSAELVARKTPCIILSSSGMATGGRILNHLKAALPDPRNIVLFTGYQAAGTRGRQLVDGAREVKIHGQLIPVAARIERMESMSAHADVNELMRWLEGFSRPPEITYLVHGEPEAIDALKARIEQRWGWQVRAPEYLETVEIG